MRNNDHTYLSQEGRSARWDAIGIGLGRQRKFGDEAHLVESLSEPFGWWLVAGGEGDQEARNRQRLLHVTIIPGLQLASSRPAYAVSGESCPPDMSASAAVACRFDALSGSSCSFFLIDLATLRDSQDRIKRPEGN